MALGSGDWDFDEDFEIIPGEKRGQIASSRPPGAPLEAGGGVQIGRSLTQSAHQKRAKVVTQDVSYYKKSPNSGESEETSIQ